ncbi:hypothetical protein GALMADRAFT_141652 [Galerina marginata CBS 339.88]|uniref:Uncharacterized protein n=1 Tax=Galerina marginata (strain CBS 339.88) TaxID=685588 RepID=A0A067SSL4_GALM3|nr:hypothetical protein GALMADRAFT_141652 [Galerina marginata CBS 339.88]
MSYKPKKEMTLYIKMLLASNDIGEWWGRIAHLFSWILLQGYVIFPSTFNAYDLADLKVPPGGTSPSSEIKRELFYIIRHVPLFWLAWGAVIIGGLGMFGCLLRWRRNYVWGLREVISPGIYAASTGVVTTVANVWGPQKGHLTAASKLTLFVTGGATVFFVLLWILYKPILLNDAKKKHIDEAGYLAVGKYGEGRQQATESVEGTGTKIADAVTAQFS